MLFTSVFLVLLETVVEISCGGVVLKSTRAVTASSAKEDELEVSL